MDMTACACVCVCVVTARDGLVCSAECTSDGCWGREDHQCVSCRNHRHGQLCVRSCSQTRGLFSIDGTSECAQCHEQCANVVNACSGPVCITAVPIPNRPRSVRPRLHPRPHHSDLITASSPDYTLNMRLKFNYIFTNRVSRILKSQKNEVYDV